MAEAWLRGPVEGVDPWLQPAAHALIQALEDVERAVDGLSAGEVWARPGGAASIGFHLRHLAGSTDRLFTYARGGQLDDLQRLRLEEEGEPGTPPSTAAELLDAVRAVFSDALAELRAARREELLDAREVGRARLPSTRLGLLFHAAEHASRHAGQVVTTERVLRGLGVEAAGR